MSPTEPPPAAGLLCSGQRTRAASAVRSAAEQRRRSRLTGLGRTQSICTCVTVGLGARLMASRVEGCRSRGDACVGQRTTSACRALWRRWGRDTRGLRGTDQTQRPNGERALEQSGPSTQVPPPLQLRQPCAGAKSMPCPQLPDSITPIFPHLAIVPFSTCAR